jgi:gamma-polyglutamate synthase
MTGTELLLLITLLLSVLGALELWLHRRNLKQIPIRVHVNGTRGKSSVTRLIAAALREAGVVTCAKTTGTLARMILPDGREVPIFRPAGANVIEQRRIVAAAAAYGAEALIIECMALQPELQALCEFKMIRATHAIITNARPDHLDVMGPGEEDVARALAGMIPPGGKIYTAEQKLAHVLAQAAQDRGAELIGVNHEAIAAITAEELDRFRYTEHRENVALALRVCEDLGLARSVALRGMASCPPDPGALTAHALDFFGRQLVFYNGFAANDPVSTHQLWNMAVQGHPELRTRIAVFNCRADRPDRSLQLGREFVKWPAIDHAVLMGTGTYLFARAAVDEGYDAGRLVLAEGLRVEEIFERILTLVQGSALVMGMGNIGGQGLALVRHFSNRALIRDDSDA